MKKKWGLKKKSGVKKIIIKVDKKVGVKIKSGGKKIGSKKIRRKKVSFKFTERYLIEEEIILLIITNKY